RQTAHSDSYTLSYTTLFRSAEQVFACARGSNIHQEELRRKSYIWSGQTCPALSSQSIIGRTSLRRGCHDRPSRQEGEPLLRRPKDRKSTRLNSSHVKISYAV